MEARKTIIKRGENLPEGFLDGEMASSEQEHAVRSSAPASELRPKSPLEATADELNARRDGHGSGMQAQVMSRPFASRGRTSGSGVSRSHPHPVSPRVGALAAPGPQSPARQSGSPQLQHPSPRFAASSGPGSAQWDLYPGFVPPPVPSRGGSGGGAGGGAGASGGVGPVSPKGSHAPIGQHGGGAFAGPGAHGAQRVRGARAGSLPGSLASRTGGAAAPFDARVLVGAAGPAVGGRDVTDSQQDRQAEPGGSSSGGQGASAGYSKAFRVLGLGEAASRVAAGVEAEQKEAALQQAVQQQLAGKAHGGSAADPSALAVSSSGGDPLAVLGLGEGATPSEVEELELVARGNIFLSPSSTRLSVSIIDAQLRFGGRGGSGSSGSMMHVDRRAGGAGGAGGAVGGGGISALSMVAALASAPYTVYLIQVRCGLRSWLVQRRFRDFSSLHSALARSPRLPSGRLPTLPGKLTGLSGPRLFSNPEALAARMRELQAYLRIVVRISEAWVVPSSTPGAPEPLVAFLDDPLRTLALQQTFARMMRMTQVLAAAAFAQDARGQQLVTAQAESEKQLAALRRRMSILASRLRAQSSSLVGLPGSSLSLPGAGEGGASFAGGGKEDQELENAVLDALQSVALGPASSASAAGSGPQPGGPTGGRGGAQAGFDFSLDDSWLAADGREGGSPSRPLEDIHEDEGEDDHTVGGDGRTQGSTDRDRAGGRERGSTAEGMALLGDGLPFSVPLRSARGSITGSSVQSGANTPSRPVGGDSGVTAQKARLHAALSKQGAGGATGATGATSPSSMDGQGPLPAGQSLLRFFPAASAASSAAAASDRRALSSTSAGGTSGGKVGMSLASLVRATAGLGGYHTRRAADDQDLDAAASRYDEDGEESYPAGGPGAGTGTGASLLPSRTSSSFLGGGGGGEEGPGISASGHWAGSGSGGGGRGSRVLSTSQGLMGMSDADLDDVVSVIMGELGGRGGGSGGRGSAAAGAGVRPSMSLLGASFAGTEGRQSLSSGLPSSFSAGGGGGEAGGAGGSSSSSARKSFLAALFQHKSSLLVPSSVGPKGGSGTPPMSRPDVMADSTVSAGAPSAPGPRPPTELLRATPRDGKSTPGAAPGPSVSPDTVTGSQHSGSTPVARAAPVPYPPWARQRSHSDSMLPALSAAVESLLSKLAAAAEEGSAREAALAAQEARAVEAFAGDCAKVHWLVHALQDVGQGVRVTAAMRAQAQGYMHGSGSTGGNSSTPEISPLYHSPSLRSLGGSAGLPSPILLGRSAGGPRAGFGPSGAGGVGSAGLARGSSKLSSPALGASLPGPASSPPSMVSLSVLGGPASTGTVASQAGTPVARGGTGGMDGPSCHSSISTAGSGAPSRTADGVSTSRPVVDAASAAEHALVGSSHSTPASGVPGASSRSRQASSADALHTTATSPMSPPRFPPSGSGRVGGGHQLGQRSRTRTGESIGTAIASVLRLDSGEGGGETDHHGEGGGGTDSDDNDLEVQLDEMDSARAHSGGAGSGSRSRGAKGARDRVGSSPTGYMVVGGAEGLGSTGLARPHSPSLSGTVTQNSSGPKAKKGGGKSSASRPHVAATAKHVPLPPPVYVHHMCAEADAVVAALGPLPAATARRAEVTHFMTHLLRRAAGLEVVPVGSTPLSLYLPDSPIDLVAVPPAATHSVPWCMQVRGSRAGRHSRKGGAGASSRDTSMERKPSTPSLHLGSPALASPAASAGGRGGGVGPASRPSSVGGNASQLKGSGGSNKDLHRAGLSRHPSAGPALSGASARAAGAGLGSVGGVSISFQPVPLRKPVYPLSASVHGGLTSSGSTSSLAGLLSGLGSSGSSLVQGKGRNRSSASLATSVRGGGGGWGGEAAADRTGTASPDRSSEAGMSRSTLQAAVGLNLDTASTGRPGSPARSVASRASRASGAGRRGGGGSSPVSMAGLGLALDGAGTEAGSASIAATGEAQERTSSSPRPGPGGPGIDAGTGTHAPHAGGGETGRAGGGYSREAKKAWFVGGYEGLCRVAALGHTNSGTAGAAGAAPARPSAGTSLPTGGRSGTALGLPVLPSPLDTELVEGLRYLSSLAEDPGTQADMLAACNATAQLLAALIGLGSGGRKARKAALAQQIKKMLHVPVGEERAAVASSSSSYGAGPRDAPGPIRVWTSSNNSSGGAAEAAAEALNGTAGAAPASSSSSSSHPAAGIAPARRPISSFGSVRAVEAILEVGEGPEGEGGAEGGSPAVPGRSIRVRSDAALPTVPSREGGLSSSTSASSTGLDSVGTGTPGGGEAPPANNAPHGGGGHNLSRHWHSPSVPPASDAGSVGGGSTLGGGDTCRLTGSTGGSASKSHRQRSRTRRRQMEVAVAAQGSGASSGGEGSGARGEDAHGGEAGAWLTTPGGGSGSGSGGPGAEDGGGSDSLPPTGTWGGSGGAGEAAGGGVDAGVKEEEEGDASDSASRPPGRVSRQGAAYSNLLRPSLLRQARYAARVAKALSSLHTEARGLSGEQAQSVYVDLLQRAVSGAESSSSTPGHASSDSPPHALPHTPSAPLPPSTTGGKRAGEEGRTALPPWMVSEDGHRFIVRNISFSMGTAWADAPPSSQQPTVAAGTGSRAGGASTSAAVARPVLSCVVDNLRVHVVAADQQWYRRYEGEEGACRGAGLGWPAPPVKEGATLRTADSPWGALEAGSGLLRTSSAGADVLAQAVRAAPVLATPTPTTTTTATVSVNTEVTPAHASSSGGGEGTGDGHTVGQGSASSHVSRALGALVKGTSLSSSSHSRAPPPAAIVPKVHASWAPARVHAGYYGPGLEISWCAFLEDAAAAVDVASDAACHLSAMLTEETAAGRVLAYQKTYEEAKNLAKKGGAGQRTAKKSTLQAAKAALSGGSTAHGAGAGAAGEGESDSSQGGGQLKQGGVLAKPRPGAVASHLSMPTTCTLHMRLPSSLYTPSAGSGKSALGKGCPPVPTQLYAAPEAGAGQDAEEVPPPALASLTPVDEDLRLLLLPGYSAGKGPGGHPLPGLPDSGTPPGSAAPLPGTHCIDISEPGPAWHAELAGQQPGGSLPPAIAEGGAPAAILRSCFPVIEFRVNPKRPKGPPPTTTTGSRTDHAGAPAAASETGSQPADSLPSTTTGAGSMGTGPVGGGGGTASSAGLPSTLAVPATAKSSRTQLTRIKRQHLFKRAYLLIHAWLRLEAQEAVAKVRSRGLLPPSPLGSEGTTPYASLSPPALVSDSATLPAGQGGLGAGLGLGDGSDVVLSSKALQIMLLCVFSEAAACAACSSSSSSLASEGGGGGGLAFAPPLKQARKAPHPQEQQGVDSRPWRKHMPPSGSFVHPLQVFTAFMGLYSCLDTRAHVITARGVVPLALHLQQLGPEGLLTNRCKALVRVSVARTDAISALHTVAEQEVLHPYASPDILSDLPSLPWPHAASPLLQYALLGIAAEMAASGQGGRAVGSSSGPPGQGQGGGVKGGAQGVPGFTDQNFSRLLLACEERGVPLPSLLLRVLLSRGYPLALAAHLMHVGWVSPHHLACAIGPPPPPQGQGQGGQAGATARQQAMSPVSGSSSSDSSSQLLHLPSHAGGAGGGSSSSAAGVPALAAAVAVGTASGHQPAPSDVWAWGLLASHGPALFDPVLHLLVPSHSISAASAVVPAALSAVTVRHALHAAVASGLGSSEHCAALAPPTLPSEAASFLQRPLQFEPTFAHAPLPSSTTTAPPAASPAPAPPTLPGSSSPREPGAGSGQAGTSGLAMPVPGVCMHVADPLLPWWNVTGGVTRSGAAAFQHACAAAVHILAHAVSALDAAVEEESGAEATGLALVRACGEARVSSGPGGAISPGTLALQLPSSASPLLRSCLFPVTAAVYMREGVPAWHSLLRQARAGDGGGTGGLPEGGVHPGLRTLPLYRQDLLLHPLQGRVGALALHHASASLATPGSLSTVYGGVAGGRRQANIGLLGRYALPVRPAPALGRGGSWRGLLPYEPHPHAHHAHAHHPHAHAGHMRGGGGLLPRGIAGGSSSFGLRREVSSDTVDSSGASSGVVVVVLAKGEGEGAQVVAGEEGAAQGGGTEGGDPGEGSSTRSSSAPLSGRATPVARTSIVSHPSARSAPLTPATPTPAVLARAGSGGVSTGTGPISLPSTPRGMSSSRPVILLEGASGQLPPQAWYLPALDVDPLPLLLARDYSEAVSHRYVTARNAAAAVTRAVAMRGVTCMSRLPHDLAELCGGGPVGYERAAYSPGLSTAAMVTGLATATAGGLPYFLMRVAEEKRPEGRGWKGITSLLSSVCAPWPGAGVGGNPAARYPAPPTPLPLPAPVQSWSDPSSACALYHHPLHAACSALWPAASSLPYLHLAVESEGEGDMRVRLAGHTAAYPHLALPPSLAQIVSSLERASESSGVQEAVRVVDGVLHATPPTAGAGGAGEADPVRALLLSTFPPDRWSHLHSLLSAIAPTPGGDALGLACEELLLLGLSPGQRAKVEAAGKAGGSSSSGAEGAQGAGALGGGETTHTAPPPPPPAAPPAPPPAAAGNEKGKGSKRKEKATAAAEGGVAATGGSSGASKAKAAAPSAPHPPHAPPFPGSSTPSTSASSPAQSGYTGDGSVGAGGQHGPGSGRGSVGATPPTPQPQPGASSSSSSYPVPPAPLPAPKGMHGPLSSPPYEGGGPRGGYGSARAAATASRYSSGAGGGGGWAQAEGGSGSTASPAHGPRQVTLRDFPPSRGEWEGRGGGGGYGPPPPPAGSWQEESGWWEEGGGGYGGGSGGRGAGGRYGLGPTPSSSSYGSPHYPPHHRQRGHRSGQGGYSQGGQGQGGPGPSSSHHGAGVPLTLPVVGGGGGAGGAHGGTSGMVVRLVVGEDGQLAAQLVPAHGGGGGPGGGSSPHMAPHTPRQAPAPMAGGGGGGGPGQGQVSSSTLLEQMSMTLAQLVLPQVQAQLASQARHPTPSSSASSHLDASAGAFYPAGSQHVQAPPKAESSDGEDPTPSPAPPAPAPPAPSPPAPSSSATLTGYAVVDGTPIPVYTDSEGKQYMLMPAAGSGGSGGGGEGGGTHGHLPPPAPAPPPPPPMMMQQQPAGIQVSVNGVPMHALQPDSSSAAAMGGVGGVGGVPGGLAVITQSSAGGQVLVSPVALQQGGGGSSMYSYQAAGPHSYQPPLPPAQHALAMGMGMGMGMGMAMQGAGTGGAWVEEHGAGGATGSRRSSKAEEVRARVRANGPVHGSWSGHAHAGSAGSPQAQGGGGVGSPHGPLQPHHQQGGGSGEGGQQQGGYRGGHASRGGRR